METVENESKINIVTKTTPVRTVACHIVDFVHVLAAADRVRKVLLSLLGSRLLHLLVL